MKPITTLAFDIYGTLIDVMGVVKVLEKHYGENARVFSQQWRDKQLEYSFRRALMQDYAPFSVCTRQALDYMDNLSYAAGMKDSPLTPSDKEELMTAYSQLPIYAEVKDALIKVKEMGYNLWAFSNGEEQQVRSLLENAGILDLFKGVVSVDAIGSFKPDPVVYKYFLQHTGAESQECLLISCNPFDILGAAKSDWDTLWLRRNSTDVFDAWGDEATGGPLQTLECLKDLPFWLNKE
ncbi:MAG: haloacid dehalogenase type II [Candidatus Portiera sp.]|nr:haloacid dehalogenase type II [Portiera sp.]